MSTCLEDERLGGSPSAASTGEESATTTTSSGSSEGPPPLVSSELEDKFTIVVDGEVIVLDDVTKQVLYVLHVKQMQKRVMECAANHAFQ